MVGERQLRIESGENSVGDRFMAVDVTNRGRVDLSGVVLERKGAVRLGSAVELLEEPVCSVSISDSWSKPRT